MKLRIIAILPLTLLLAACAGQAGPKVIIPQGPVETRFEEWIDPLETWQIVESQNGRGEADLPRWVRYFFDREPRMIEYMERFRESYVFIARNQGDNLGALRQWADNFCPEQDLSLLIAQRVERRFAAGASLYPDDEYGEYFVNTIRRISGWDYPDAVREETFWVRRRMVSAEGHDEDYGEAPEIPERFEFLVLVTIDRETLRERIRGVMADTSTRVPPTREQAAAIGNIRQTFFEGF